MLCRWGTWDLDTSRGAISSEHGSLPFRGRELRGLGFRVLQKEGLGVRVLRRELIRV